MTEIDVLLEAGRLAADGEAAAALATVVRAAGSVPRRPPAKMIVRADGRVAGTVGGGRIEHEVIRAAREVGVAGGPARLLRLHLARDLAMCCGGEVEVFLEPLDPARCAAMAEAAFRREGRRATALVTLLDGAGKRLLDEDACLRTRRPRLEEGRFVEPVLPPDRVAIFGGGHVGRAVAELADGVGFQVIVCEEDERLAAPDRFPAAARILPTYDAREVAAALAPFGARDYALVVSHEHALDEKILEQLLPIDGLTYLGMLGSHGKVARFRQRLEARGLADPARWERLHAPVGLSIHADTPAEIAVAIVAELISVRNADVARSCVGA